MLNLRPYQERSLKALREGIRCGHDSQILYMPTGAGKCLGENTPILMADGSIKLVQDVVSGDKLMGPDGRPRNVLDICSGREKLYRIVPKKGDSYIVNASHILSLKRNSKDRITLADGTIIEKNDEVINVNVEVLKHSSKTAKHCLKGWRSELIEQFHRPSIKGEFLLPPYILGAWLGDGGSGKPIITKPFCSMVKEWIEYGKSFGYKCAEENYSGKCPSWRLTKGNDGYSFNLIQNALSLLGVLHNKYVPDEYKYADSWTRKELLAGLIDSDGHISHAGCDWISKDKRLAEDFVFICRSLGLSCYLSYQNKKINSYGFSGWYWRASVSGDLSILPMRDKKCPPRKQKKRNLVHGIEIESIGQGRYYGFSIDGDKLFLLGDFTVTHNTESAISLLVATANAGNRAAMVLDRRILCEQTSERLDKYDIDHGVLMSGHWRYRTDRSIQICSAQTLEARGSFPGLKLLIVDEAHTIRKTTADFIQNTGIRTIGLSASPFTKGLGNIYTNVVSEITTRDLVGEGSLVPLRVFIAKEIDMQGAKKVAGEWSQKEATERGIKITGDIVSEWVKKTHEVFGGPRKTIVFCAGVAHGADLAEKFAEAGYNFVSISYKDDDQFKQDAIKEFSKPDSSIHGLIATDILTKGFDVPDVMIGVSARPFTKSFSSHVQQMGRCMRPFFSKEFALWLDHSGNYLRFKEDWEDLYRFGVDKLDDGMEKPKKEPSQEDKEAAKCPKCSRLWPSKSDVCAHCGFVRERRNDVSVKAGELIELGNTLKDDSDYKRSFFQQLLYIESDRSYKSGWAKANYHKKFGAHPRWPLIESEPNSETLKWVRSQLIRYAKRRK